MNIRKFSEVTLKKNRLNILLLIVINLVENVLIMINFLDVEIYVTESRTFQHCIACAIYLQNCIRSVVKTIFMVICILYSVMKHTSVFWVH